MATSEVGYSSNSGNSGTGTVPHISGLAANDKIVLAIVNNTSAAVPTTPSGFSVLSARVSVGTTLHVAFFWKNATGSETGNLSIDLGSNCKWAAGMGAVRGAEDPVVSVTSSGDNTTDTTTDYPGYTPPAADSFMFAIGGLQVPTTPNVHTVASGWANEVETYSAATDPNVGVLIASRQLVSGSSVGSTTGSNTQSIRDILYMVGFEPATVGSNEPPVANAGSDQSGLEPFSVVSLNFGGSTDPDGTIVSYNVTQTAGPTVTLSGSGNSRTFNAPPVLAGTTLTFSLTVTDDDGDTSSADTVNISVLPHDLWVRAGGSWVARRNVKHRSDSTWT